MLILTAEQCAAMRQEACTHAPHECCGLVGGRYENDKLIALTLYPCSNAAAEPKTRYEIDPAELFRHHRRMRERTEELVAIYHSHPAQTLPLPSPTDLELAFYPTVAYIIIGGAGKVPCIRAFRLFRTERRWEEIRLTVE